MRGRSGQGEKRENTGSILPMNNAARLDSASVESSGTFTAGCSCSAPVVESHDIESGNSSQLTHREEGHDAGAMTHDERCQLG